ncbi:serine hydrolase domain-containing protein [Streptomyces subrutilus]|uniref:serine hydrolase domain-containing protein n=1 Tax=Streptomyces subrutilus TaxID=36818 RepID=UPI0033FED058
MNASRAVDRTPRTSRRRARLVAPCALLLALGGLPLGPTAVAAADPSPAPSPTPSASAPRSPTLKRIDPAAFRAAVERAAKALGVPGAVVLLQTPQGTYRALVGTSELGRAEPPDPGDHFRIASNTKTMTSALIMLLVQDGSVRLTDPVSRYVAGVPNGAKITIADLLTMRSGLYNYTDAPELAAALDADPGRAWTPQDVLDIAYRRPPDAAPGTSYAYDNTNYVLLGLVAEKAGGRPLAEQFRDRLFAPLGIDDTFLPDIHDRSLPAPFAHGYMYGGSSYALVDKPYPPAIVEGARTGTLRPVDRTRQNPSYATAAGGVVSTARSMATWIRALVTGKVLNAATQQQWLRSPRREDPAAPDGQKYGYGIAYQRFAPNAAMYYHGGELPGFNSFIGHDPDSDVTLVVWTNLTVSPDGRATAIALLPTVLNQVYTGLALPTGHSG